MGHGRWVVLSGLLLAACETAAPAPTPVPPPIAVNVPFFLTLGVTVGAGRATIVAKVQNGIGDPIAGVLVHFATDTGTLSDVNVYTIADGTAITVVTANGQATVAAAAGSLTRSTIVILAAPPSSPRSP
jgi:hypothetical protein